MRTHFVKTKNFDRLIAGVQLLDQRGAREAAGMVVNGRPGDGKTTNLQHWGASVGAVFVTCYPSMTDGRLLELIALKLGIPPTRYIDDAIGEQLTLGQTPVLLDEAQFALTNGAAALERLRIITSKSGTPFIVVMMERDLWRLGQHEQLSSRMACRVTFEPADVTDVSAVCGELAEVGIHPDLVRRIQVETGGRMRSVLNAISRIEIAARARGRDEMDLASMHGVALVDDYRAGLPALGSLRSRSAARKEG